MKLVAAAKVRRAQDAVVNGRPFAENLVKVWPFPACCQTHASTSCQRAWPALLLGRRRSLPDQACKGAHAVPVALMAVCIGHSSLDKGTPLACQKNVQLRLQARARQVHSCCGLQEGRFIAAAGHRTLAAGKRHTQELRGRMQLTKPKSTAVTCMQQ